MIYIIILVISILFILYNIVILESFNTTSVNTTSVNTISVNAPEYYNETDDRDDLNFFISPAKDINGNILASTKYFHGHDHEHKL